jgi:hypothetical protein
MKYEEPCDTGITVNDFYNMSAAVIDVSGRTATASQVDTKTMRLSIPAGAGSFTIFIGSAASMNKTDNVTAIASAAVDTAKSTGYTGIYNSHTAWWHNYWSKSFITFPSVQGQGYDKDYGAHFINYYYIMGSCFRGAYPAKFNGLLFNTASGYAPWGSEYWIFNDGRAYYGLETGNHPELLDPFLNMISGNLGKYQTAAQQQWGSQGIYIPETSSFDGPEVLPETIASSLQNSLLNGLDITQAVKDFMYNRTEGADSRWTILGLGGQWKAGYHSHLVYDTADIANMYWDRYLYTQDINYLRDTAYPVIKGAAEFYRTFPNLKKGTDNKYHIYKTGFAETIFGADDILNDLNYIRGLLPAAAKAAQLLNVDSNLIPLWQDIVANLAPNPLSSDPNAVLPRPRADGKPTYALAHSPTIYNGPKPTVWDEYQVELLDFDQVNLESKANGVNLNAWDLNMNTLETQEAYQNYSDGVSAGGGTYERSWSRFMTDCSRMGRSDKVKEGLTSHLMFWKNAIVSNPNRLPSTNDGTQTMSVQEDGVFVEGMQNALLQSLAKGPGENPVIYAFGAWPLDIDAAFQLQAKKGFTVTSSLRSQNIEFVEIYSGLGKTCDVNNPWGAAQSVDLYRNGVISETLSGRLLSFNTAIGENVVIVKSGTTPAQYQRTVSYPAPIFMSAAKTLLQAGETTQLTSFSSANLSGATITYTSSNIAVASVDNNGLVTGNTDGIAVITEKALSGQNVVASGQLTLTVEPPNTILNDTDTGISYTGSFSYSNNRGVGDYMNDVHQTQTDGDYFQYTFTGTGVDYMGVMNSDIGNQDVYIDGVLMQTVSGTASSYTPQAVLYSNKNLTNGTHTIKVVKKSGSWMVLDALKIYVSNATILNDTDTGISYTGSFSYSSNRGAGDYMNDVHQTQTDGDYFQYTFTGVGVDYLGVMNSDIGNQDVYIDGVLMQTASGTASSYTPQAVLYSNKNHTNGTHTIKVVKKSGSWMVLDALKIYVSNATILNDTDTGISYTGSFSYSNNRGVGDYNNDVHYTTASGAYFQYTFTGTVVDLITEMYTDEGNMDIYIDDVLQQTVNCYNATRLAQQTVFSISGLASGSHTIKAVKKDGAYMLLDALKITQ